MNNQPTNEISRVEWLNAPLFTYARFTNGSVLPAACISVAYGPEGAPVGARVMCLASDGNLYPCDPEMGFEYLFVDDEDRRGTMLPPNLSPQKNESGNTAQ